MAVAGPPSGGGSFRLNEILIPQGFHSEIRLALRHRGRLWGALVLFWEDRARLFDDSDTAAVCAVAEPLVDAMRAYPVRPLPAQGTAPGSGVVALAPDNQVVAVSGQAQAWLDDLIPGGEDQTNASDVMRVLFDAAHALRRGEPDPSTCVRTVRGHWLRVQATSLSIGEADVAVVLQPATVHQLLATIAAGHRLTPREAEILGLLGRGLASKAIARKLAISLLTVNGHLRSLYRKCGVSGREDLFGRLV